MAANIHLGNDEFSLLVARVGRSFNCKALAVKERESGNAIVFARKDRLLVRHQVEDVVRPRDMGMAQWKLLQTAFDRIRGALDEQPCDGLA